MHRLTTHFKIDIARNMLHTALSLYIDNGDRFSVLQLSGAVEEVISGLIKQRRVYDPLANETKTAREMHLENIDGIYKSIGKEKTNDEMRVIGQGMNFARNHTKHHDVNQSNALALDIDIEAHRTLRRAVDNYKLYIGDLTELMRSFQRIKAPESSFGTKGSAPDKMTTKFSALVPELIVSDLQASMQFWCGVVGFNVWYDRPEDNFSYLTLGSAQIMLEQRSKTDGDWVSASLEQPYGRGVNFQIQVPSLKEVISRCNLNGIDLFLPEEERWYRRGTEEVGQKQCIVSDPDGYLVRCIQPIGERPVSKSTD